MWINKIYEKHLKEVKNQNIQVKDNEKFIKKTTGPKILKNHSNIVFKQQQLVFTKHFTAVIFKL